MAHSKRPRRNTQLLNQDNSEHEVRVNALKPRFRAPSPEEYVDEDPPLHLFFDSLKTDFAELDTSDSETGSDVDDQDDWEELNDEQLLAIMSEMDNKLQDPDWLPERLRKKAEIRAKSKMDQASSNDELEPTEIGMDSDETTEEAEDVDDETWEDELMLSAGGDIMRFRDWSKMCKNIKSDLKKNSKSFSLAQINKLTILSYFATLCIKCSWIQASAEIARQWHEGEGIHFAWKVRALVRHYQIFAQLPMEKRGGKANAHSWLHDKAVQAHTRSWLTAQKVGSVTPKKLQHALTSAIFPDLGIHPKQPLSMRTARRWLLKLGWRCTMVQKGVYMDGHERDDVVKYRREVFLPLMAQYEAQMVQYEGPELKKVEPHLKPGEKRIIAQFHDECCFHANDQSNTAWVKWRYGTPKGLRSVLTEQGFDVRQLKAKCSPVCPFESKGCCMAHLLSQQDDFANQESMLETLIKKTGHLCILLPKFHCELNPIEMYWGWCKYRYRETPKNSFGEAKKAAEHFLNACPLEVFHCFINHSWHFMSAYQKGLTGEAAAWAVIAQHYMACARDASTSLYSLLPAGKEIELNVSASGEAARLQDHVVLAKHLAQSSR
ncbi:hypothetical protein CY34DRAFT_110837 [Suillus luteus UH-Slu-Lm8-n1]|uniref:Tc1-like transposase DDE domain-containing protein n=1 Tax=Suillus luteus UH-Slu-Lm8-n1 TaxID=930992 RepID=A0A0D0AF23_9AGAM|nr:hypothetical protein CY34DRAFT_110837 [Suillus luteus UH-Slu-Lm8-n1]